MSTKQFFAFLLSLVITASACILPVAATNCAAATNQVADNLVSAGEISLRWVEALSARATISKSGTTLYSKAYLQARSSGTSISGTLYLEKYVNGKWRTEKSWRISGTGLLDVQKSKSCKTGVTYRTSFVVYAGTERVEQISASLAL